LWRRETPQRLLIQLDAVTRVQLQALAHVRGNRDVPFAG
jgi:hypothetical protein